MPNAKDVTVTSEYLKVFSVGLAGSGKSIFASSFPTPGFVFDFSNGIQSYRGKDFDYEQFDVSVNGWNKFEKLLPEIDKSVRANKYKTVVVDDLTAMTDVCMDKALQLDPKRSASQGPLWNVHYQLVRNLMEGKLRKLIDLPANIIFIGHLDTEKDQETGAIIEVRPMLTGQLHIKIPSYFDEVFYHVTKREGGETKWFMQTVPIGWNHGRSRLSGKEHLLPDVLENDYKIVMDYLTGKIKNVKKGGASK
jgi:hypothetical protein